MVIPTSRRLNDESGSKLDVLSKVRVVAETERERAYSQKRVRLKIETETIRKIWIHGT